MKFGLGPLTTQIPPDDPRSPGDKFHELIEMARRAEEVGFDSVWLAEHHGSEDNYLSTPFSLSAALARETDRITLGTSVAIAAFHEPSRLAETVAAIDLLSDGRVELGLGMGYQDREFERFGIPRSERVQRLVDAVEVCKRAWSGEEFSYRGETVEYRGIRVTPAPVDDDALRIVLGCFAEPAVRRAARIADGFLAPSKVPVEGIAQRQQWAHEEAADPDRFRTHVLRDTYLGDSADQAWQSVAKGVLYANQKIYEAFQACSDDVEIPYPDEDYLRSNALCGNPSEMVEQILAFDDLMGPEDHMIFRLEYPGLPHDQVLATLERMGRQVLPDVRSALPGGN